MDADQVLAHRLARSGLSSRDADGLAAAAACPASDFSRDAALLALAARADGVTAEAYRAAVDAGELVLAHLIRGAIHVVEPEDFARFGRALIARDGELAAQLGRQAQKLLAAHGIAPDDALAAVAAATKDSLSGGRALDKNGLHAALRERVDAALMPWCDGCQSYHVAPMLWRYATIKAGVRLDADRRYVIGRPGRPPAARTAAARFLHYYGPSTPAAFAEWAGLARPHARRLWDQLSLAEVAVEGKPRWLAAEDAAALESPPDAAGVRLLPPGDPFLQKPNRALLAPDKALRKRLFRPVASPGAVLRDGRLVGLWSSKIKKATAEITVQPLDRLSRADLAEEAERIASLRHYEDLELVVS